MRFGQEPLHRATPLRERHWQVDRSQYVLLHSTPPVHPVLQHRMSDPYALNDDGTAKDPAAFRAALKADPAKLEAIEKEPEVAEVVLGNDDHAFQELIKSVYHVSAGVGT